jgi:hypothetical protein
MTRLVLSVLLLASASVAGAPAPLPKTERKTDLEKIQGEWIRLRSVSGELHLARLPQTINHLNGL